MHSKKKLWSILLPMFVIAALTAVFCFGGNERSGENTIPEPPTVATAPALPAAEQTPDALVSDSQANTDQTTPAPVPEELSIPPVSEERITEEPSADEPESDSEPLPVEPQDADIGTTAYSCTISISCAAILENMDALESDKADLVPADGWILPPTSVTFYEGESVFNVLQRTCKQQRIHMEFEDTPIYNSAYIEGIHNLYEFDAGELSGWMYSVNDWFPNYGCSRYQLNDGDVICWVYTCDLGEDVGGGNSAGNGVY